MMGIRTNLALLTALMLTLAGTFPVQVSDTHAGQFGPAVTLDRFGGHPDGKTARTGRFEVGRKSFGSADPTWWLIDPDGNAFYANSVSLVDTRGLRDVNGNNPYQSTLLAKYGNLTNPTAWTSDVEDRLRSWGYNSVGAWSSSALYSRVPHTVELLPMLAAVNSVYPTADATQCSQLPIICEESRPEWDAMYRRYFFDVFDPRFQAVATNHITSTITANGYASDEYLIGYFADNELPFWLGRSPNSSSPWYEGNPNDPTNYPQEYPKNTLADVFIALPASAPGKQAWVDHLQGIHGSIGVLNSAWGNGANYDTFDALKTVYVVPSSNHIRAVDKLGFLSKIVDKYFSTIKNAILSVDSSHLYLGPRFVTGGVDTSAIVWSKAGQYLDVIGVNYYIWENESYSQMYTEINAKLGNEPGGIFYDARRPILVTEFSFSASDSVMPCTPDHRNGTLVDTQEQRAQLYADYQRVVVESPYVVGLTWWAYFDPPPAGNAVGLEDCNLGLVDNSDNPYLRMLYRVQQESATIYSRRGLVAPSRPILGSTSASTTYASIVRSGASLRVDEPAGTATRASVRPLWPDRGTFQPATDHKVYLPLIVKSYQGQAQTTFFFSLQSPVSGVTIDIYDGTAASATLRRRLTLSSYGPGNQSVAWDGLDQNGFHVSPGSYFYVVTATPASGQKDYAMGTFTR